jgi:hypothetical protein
MNARFSALFALLLLVAPAMATANIEPPPAEHPPAVIQEATSFESLDFDAGFRSFNNSPGRFDRNADGRVDLIVIDRNNDGSGDYWATDRNFDGVIDDYQYDRNFDSRMDQWEYDYDGDGIPDKIFVDADGDGKSEMYSEWNPVSRTYNWYGAPSGKRSFGGIRPTRKLAKGKAAFSE